MHPCSVRSLLEYSVFSFSHLSAKGITGIYFRSRDIKTSFFPTSWVPTTQVNVIPVLKRPFIPSRSDQGLHFPGLWQADLLSLVTPLLGFLSAFHSACGMCGSGLQADALLQVCTRGQMTEDEGHWAVRSSLPSLPFASTSCFQWPMRGRSITGLRWGISEIIFRD